jgi:hypothetical protein
LLSAAARHRFLAPLTLLKLRRMRRAVALAFALAICIVRYWLATVARAAHAGAARPVAAGSARRNSEGLGIGSQVEGKPPRAGWWWSNHLSYLDIIIISAAMPCFFVAKMEIGGWPFFGKAARAGGTIFLDRSSLGQRQRPWPSR